MKRQVHKLITHILPLLAFVFITNVGSCAELDAETKSLIAKAEQGDADAQHRLGVMYAERKGVSQDHKEAEKSMTPDQIAKAQKLSREWFEKY